MMRFLTVFAMLGAFFAALALYWIKYDTRRLEADIRQKELEIERLEKAIAVGRAERAYLSRPERIEPLAREHLGMRPTSADQNIQLPVIARGKP